MYMYDRHIRRRVQRCRTQQPSVWFSFYRLHATLLDEMLFATVTSVAGRIFGAYITAFGQRRMTVEHQKPNNFIEEKKINDVTAVGLL
ncbi:hypothetical protein OUZ56_003954 [Daphnia magna]|uniref:Uncharacterized protein n=1 Tax=Daphnia magna TaxID=35525 RepID=A0ABQ9YNB8_9CRUS|nr:hypothetical protein OUZ56_003954 [Daphnia magna]